MRPTIYTQNNLITKLVTITTKLLNIEPTKYQVKRIEVFNNQDVNNANIRFIKMMNISI